MGSQSSQLESESSGAAENQRETIKIAHVEGNEEILPIPGVKDSHTKKKDGKLGSSVATATVFNNMAKDAFEGCNVGEMLLEPQDVNAIFRRVRECLRGRRHLNLERGRHVFKDFRLLLSKKMAGIKHALEKRLPPLLLPHNRWAAEGFIK